MRQYKDSGIEWIGKIPEDWEVCRFKDFLSLKNEPSDSPNKIGLENIESETGRFIPSTSTFDGNGTSFSIGDIVYGKLRPYLRKAWLAEFDGNAVGDFFVFKCKDNINNKYAKWLLLSDGFTEIVNSSTFGAKMPRVSSSFILTLPYYLPPLSDQQRIADYLDEKCGEIDSLIGLQEQMIEKLKAYKQSVITEAVTKGLDPNAKLVPSGIDWIGEIPEGWTIGRIKNVASLFGRIGFRGYNSDDLNKEGVGAITLSPSNMQPMDMDYSAVTYLSWKKYYESPEIMIQNGDLLYVKTGSSYGKVSYVHDLPREATINPQILRIVPKIYNKYLGYYMQSTFCEYQTKVGVVGGTIPTISQEKINNFWVLLPSEPEQRAIVSYLDSKCADIDRLIALKQQKIEALKDYKKSVIYESVTGKTTIE